MAIDIGKIKAKIEEEKRLAAQRKSFEKIRWWKPRVGENLIRLMPPWTSEGPNADVFYRETYRHWSVGSGGYDKENGLNFTCPVKTPDGPGGVCEVCDHAKKLRQSGDPTDLEEAKLLSAKKRISSNIVDLNDPVLTAEDVQEWVESHPPNAECPFKEGDTKVQIWSYGATLFGELLDYFADSVPLAELVDGHNIKLTRTGKNKEDTRYRLRPDMTATNFDFVGDFGVLVYDLDSLSPFPEEGAMAAALSGPSASRLPPAPPAPGVESVTNTTDMSDKVKELEARMKSS